MSLFKKDKSDILHSAHPAATELCKALGLEDQHVTFIAFKLQAGHIGKLTVEMYPSVKQGEEMAKVLKRFKLVDREAE